MKHGKFGIVVSVTVRVTSSLPTRLWRAAMNFLSKLLWSPSAYETTYVKEGPWQDIEPSVLDGSVVEQSG